MCAGAHSHAGCQPGGCGCGGHGAAKAPARPDPRQIMALRFDGTHASPCACSGHTCPRHYLAVSGLMLGAFLVLHLSLNALALWPERFQIFVNHTHSLGGLLPALEICLIFIPLAIHLNFGVRTLKREKLKYGVAKHHHGSDLRQWLQRVTAVILLLFLTFHIVTLHRWLGGRFDSQSAFNSASQAIWQFWHGQPAGSFPNLLFAQFYLLGIVAAVYHITNGVATGTEVLGWVKTPAMAQRVWRISLVVAPGLLLAGLVAWYALAIK